MLASHRYNDFTSNTVSLPLPMQQINVHTPATPVASATEEFTDINIEFVELAPKSSKVARTLHRYDDVAYRIACGRTHALLAKKRKRPRASLSPDCLTMMQFGRGMKIQVGRKHGRTCRLIFVTTAVPICSLPKPLLGRIVNWCRQQDKSRPIQVHNLVI